MLNLLYLEYSKIQENHLTEYDINKVLDEDL
jgi:hypothetical protein